MLMTYPLCFPKPTSKCWFHKSGAAVMRFAQVLNALSRRSTATVVCPRER